MAAPLPSKLDLPQILQRVYDEARGTLRVDSTATIGDISIAVDLDPTEDGIYIADKDSGNKLKINGDGSINVTFIADNVSTVPSISNISIALPNIENIVVLPISTKQFELKVRGNLSNLKIAYGLGQSFTNYATITRGCNYTVQGLNLTTLNRALFVQSDKGGIIIECIIWT